MKKHGGLFSRRSSATLCDGPGAMVAVTPCHRSWIGLCTWPHMTLSTCGCDSRSARPAPRRHRSSGPSMWAMPVRNGGWCMKMAVGQSGARARAWSSHCRRRAHIVPPGAPGMVVSRPISRTGLVLHDVLQKLPVARQVVVVGEGTAKILAIIVISGDPRKRDIPGGRSAAATDGIPPASRSLRDRRSSARCRGLGSSRTRCSTQRARLAAVSTFR